MSKNEGLWGVIAVLILALVLESGYILHTQNHYEKLSVRPLVRHPAGLASPRVAAAIPSPMDESSLFEQNPDVDEWEPQREMERIQRQMNRLFRDSLDKASRDRDEDPLRSPGFFEPDMDVKQNDTAYIVRMDVPGINKEQINIELKGNLLTVSGERKAEADEAGGGLVKKERSFGYFSRTVSLPEDVKADAIKADYANGVLVMTIPKITRSVSSQSAVTKIKVN